MFLNSFCMNFLVLPRIRDNIRLRKNKISNDIERAELLKEQIEKTIQEYDIKIMQAKNQAMEITKNAIEKANQDFASQLEAVKKRITLKISKKEEELTEHKKKIQRDIESASVNLASVIVEKVVGKTIGKMTLIL